MILRTMALAALLAVPACNKPAVDERNASVADVAKAVKQAQSGEMKFTPGRWESTFSIVSMEAPGMPPQASQAMNGMIGKKQAYATCLTRQQADKPSADFFSKNAKNCTYEHFTMGSGKIDARMTCGAGGGEAVMTMNGSYGPDYYAMNMATVTRAGGRAPMTMRMAIDAHHAGACKGDEDGHA